MGEPVSTPPPPPQPKLEPTQDAAYRVFTLLSEPHHCPYTRAEHMLTHMPNKRGTKREVAAREGQEEETGKEVCQKKKQRIACLKAALARSGVTKSKDPKGNARARGNPRKVEECACNVRALFWKLVTTHCHGAISAIAAEIRQVVKGAMSGDSTWFDALVEAVPKFHEMASRAHRTMKTSLRERDYYRKQSAFKMEPDVFTTLVDLWNGIAFQLLSSLRVSMYSIADGFLKEGGDRKGEIAIRMYLSLLSAQDEIAEFFRIHIAIFVAPLIHVTEVVEGAMNDTTNYTSLEELPGYVLDGNLPWRERIADVMKHCTYTAVQKKGGECFGCKLLAEFIESVSKAMGLPVPSMEILYPVMDLMKPGDIVVHRTVKPKTATANMAALFMLKNRDFEATGVRAVKLNACDLARMCIVMDIRYAPITFNVCAMQAIDASLQWSAFAGETQTGKEATLRMLMTDRAFEEFRGDARMRELFVCLCQKSRWPILCEYVEMMDVDEDMDRFRENLGLAVKAYGTVAELVWSDALSRRGTKDFHEWTETYMRYNYDPKVDYENYSVDEIRHVKDAAAAIKKTVCKRLFESGWLPRPREKGTPPVANLLFLQPCKIALGEFFKTNKVNLRQCVFDYYDKGIHRLACSPLILAMRYSAPPGSPFLADAGDRTEIVEMLLEAGADVNHRNNENETALHFAVTKMFDTAAVAALLRYGASPHVRVIGENRTPYDLAKNAGRDKIAEVLLRAMEKEERKWMAAAEAEGRRRA